MTADTKRWATTIASVAAAGLALVAMAGCSGVAAADGAPTGADEAPTVRAVTPSTGSDASGPAPSADQRRTITVTGTGTVAGTPDTVTVQLGVQTRATTANAALTENNTAANAVIKQLRKAGVAKKDLQTSQISLHPTYASKGSHITGYEVSNFVTATLHDVGKAGAIIDAAQQAAGDAARVNNVQFSFADDSKLRAEARAHAVKQALAQAGELADAAGLAVGDVLSITEGAPQSDQPTELAAGAMAAPDAAMPMPLLPGSQDMTVHVRVVVAIG